MSPSDACRCRCLRCRLPNRRFRAGDRISHIYDHVDIAVADRGGSAAWPAYDLISNMPVRAYRDRGETVEAAGMSGQIMLMVQQIAASP